MSVLPVARIDLAFDDPGMIIREALKSLLPDVSGNKEEMTENVKLILEEVGEANKLTISFTQTDAGVSILFMKESILEIPKHGTIQHIQRSSAQSIQEPESNKLQGGSRS